MWWGFSQSLDLLDEWTDGEKKEGGGDKSEANCNVLLVGQCDGRHMLKTIAQKYRHIDVKVNLYIYEPLLENVARELLFTTLALEPPENVGISEKTLFFLELYGNTLLRPATSKYLTKVSKRLLNVITNLEYGEKILPFISLDNLKYKERDQLEVIFKHWACENRQFNILTGWEERLRKHLGVRYDNRHGVYDWDYHMRYHCFGADVLQLQEYKKFRETGVAFYFQDTNPCVPNRTLESAIFSAGSKILSHGYLGDIITGPYVTFGLSCEDKNMLKKVNGQMRKTATDITEHNLMQIFHEIQHQTPFVPLDSCNDGYPSVVILDDSAKLKILETNCDSLKSDTKVKDSCKIYQSLNTNNCRIIFMSTNVFNSNLEKYKNFFDILFISQTMVLKHFKPQMIDMMKPNSKVIADTPKFLLNYRKEDLEKFKTDLVNLMKDLQCKLISPYNSETDEFVRFKVEK